MKEKETKEVLEFYEHTTSVNQNSCEHFFLRLSNTRVICKSCGVGFYDTPINPFPVDEINKKTLKDKRKRKSIEKHR